MTLHIKGFPEELHQEAREVAVGRRESLKDLVIRAVEREVERCKQAKGDE